MLLKKINYQDHSLSLHELRESSDLVIYYMFNRTEEWTIESFKNLELRELVELLFKDTIKTGVTTKWLNGRSFWERGTGDQHTRSMFNDKWHLYLNSCINERFKTMFIDLKYELQNYQKYPKTASMINKIRGNSYLSEAEFNKIRDNLTGMIDLLSNHKELVEAVHSNNPKLRDHFILEKSDITLQDNPIDDNFVLHVVLFNQDFQGVFEMCEFKLKDTFLENREYNSENVICKNNYNLVYNFCSTRNTELTIQVELKLENNKYGLFINKNPRPYEGNKIQTSDNYKAFLNKEDAIHYLTGLNARNEDYLTRLVNC